MAESILVSLAVTLRIISNPSGNVFQKQLALRGSHPLIVNLVTYLLLSTGCIFISYFIQWPDLNHTFWTYSILGGVAGALGNGFLVKALHKGDLSVLGPINAYKSVIGVIAGIFLLSEMPGIRGMFGILLIIYGSYFVLDTTEERFSPALLKKSEIRFRIWAMVLTAIEAVFIKKVILASSAAIAFISWCVFGSFFAFLFLTFYRLNLKEEFKKTFRIDNLNRYLVLILCVGTMQLTTNYTFNHMPVGYALSLFQLSTIVSVLFGYNFFQEKELWKRIFGTVIMIAGSVMIIILKDS